MPYIKKEARYYLDDGDLPTTPGELNYTLTKIIEKYLDFNDCHYTSFNDVVGALECCKLEFYRRIVSPYEDIKMKENGDVW